MGFSSPVQDFIEGSIDLNKIFVPHPYNMLRIETPTGCVLVDRSMTPVPGDTVAYQLEDYPQLGKLFRSGIITQDGETINGEGMEGTIVLGKVTAEIVSVHEVSRPTI